MDKRSLNENQQSSEELSSMDIIKKYLRNRSDAEIQYSQNVLRINEEFLRNKDQPTTTTTTSTTATQHQQQQQQQQQQSKNSKQRPTTTANNSNDYLKRKSDHIDIDANKSKKSNNLVNSDDSDDVDEGNSDLLDGKSTYLNGEFICAFKGCTYKSNNVKYLQLHQKTHYSHTKIYPCPKCSAIFLSEPGLHGHAFRNHLSS
ncbi:hypothetical protein DERP_003929 [Dermatophagoides pteronyssinus]|uniref:C2H2-type domain-containing protein n=1 Tax=Dermatophagoides pteronyssinus TaxID=6956 RepID=A0ABQ8J7M9_DERPT|nr:hypothetical protein DERP_003929 [Dermatophagoides pteronyssinus]